MVPLLSSRGTWYGLSPPLPAFLPSSSTSFPGLPPVQKKKARTFPFTILRTDLLITPAFQKCDAQRPCATCKRSHANQIATAMPGVEIPPEPVCTYDDLPERQEAPEKHPGEGGIRARYERLEARIGQFPPFFSKITPSILIRLNSRT